MIVEAVVAVVGLAMIAIAVYTSMTRINDFATANRLNSLATSVITDRAERALAPTQFFYTSPGSSTNVTPAELTSGTSSAAVAIYVDPDITVSGTSAAQLQISNTGSATLAPSSFALVTGTMTTAITDMTPTVASGTSLTVYLKRTDVTLNYKYRGRNYSVTTSTLRSPTM